MCTVTIVPRDDGFRLVCNRDERRDRPAATPPHAPPGWTALYPIDPLGGGTWVGVNAAGLAAAVLNRTADPGAPRRPGESSRGRLVPLVLAHGSMGAAMQEARALDASAFAPFGLVVVHRQAVGVLTSDGRRLSLETSRLSAPILFTSSSLGDALVDPPRRALFDRLMTGGPGAWLRAQRAFHRHQWPRRLDISVLMARADAGTVSRTAIDVRSDQIHLRYEPLGAAPAAEEAI